LGAFRYGLPGAPVRHCFVELHAAASFHVLDQEAIQSEPVTALNVATFSALADRIEVAPEGVPCSGRGAGASGGCAVLRGVAAEETESGVEVGHGRV
jgi:hypothetical protein